MRVKYIKIYKPFVGNVKFKFTLNETYDVIEYNISTQKMITMLDDNGNQIKISNNSNMMKHFQKITDD